MIQQLIGILHSELELTAEEIADLLWLTLERQKNVKSIASPKNQSQKPEVQQAAEITISEAIESLSTQEESSSSNKDSNKEASSIFIYGGNQTATSSDRQKGYVQISVPDARSLREPLDFIRALKPLLKQVPSQTEQVINEQATVDWIAQTDLWMPILQPSLESWLELALVIDESKSMILWRHLVKELQQVLTHYGMFRDVRLWGINKDHTNQISLRSQTRFHSAKELIDPQNRRLIMVVSDGVDDIWRDAQIIPILAEWTASNPVVMLQMLPRWMWSRTALGIGTSAQFSILGSSIVNSSLTVGVKRLAKRRNLDQGINLPVITLEPKQAKDWSRMLAGEGEQSIVGYVLRADLLAASSAVSSSEAIPARERVSNFNVNASPLAKDLVGLLAAAPVITMPVIRLIQDSMLKESNQIHVAEVFLGGLLKPSAEITPTTDPEQMQYEFIHGVRSELLQSVAVPDSEKVFDQVSRYVAKGLGKSLRDFIAWLRDPSQIDDEEQASTVKPFAKVAEEILQQLGYSFAESEPISDSWQNLEDEKPLKPELQTFTFEVATIAIKLEFKIVTLVPKEQIKNRLSLEEINLIEKYYSEASGTPNGYQSYKELSSNEQEAIDYRISPRQSSSDVAIVAPHGGKIQSGTTEIADAIAGADYAFYSFEGIKHGSENDVLYIPSHKFDEPQALDLVSKANRVIVIHGYVEDVPIIFLGGLDDKLKEQIRQSLRKEGFTNIVNATKPYRGTHSKNICNRGKTGKGVQISLSSELRKQLFDSLKSEKTNEPTLYHRFVQAIRDALSPLEAAGWRSQITQGEADYYTEDLGNGRGLDMIYIPGGSFMMGSPKEELESYDDERPQHEVTVSSFYMGRYPITQAQWKAVAELEAVERTLDSDPSEFKDDYEGIDRWQKPVEQVSWSDAKEFCDRLSKKTGKEYRLPTEAEWEYACRAGTTTPFHFGETISTDLANYNGSIYGEGVEGESRGQTTTVGYFKVANNFGLYDMHGNVWEWCEDNWHENYQDAPNDGSAWLSGNSSIKVMRGGSWYNSPHGCRSASRYNYARVRRFINFGFRVVCVVPRTI